MSKLKEITNKLFNVDPNEQIVRCFNGDHIIPKKDMIDKFIPNMQNLISTLETKNYKQFVVW